jgi:solute carrier family 35 (adenosine 3'-phospho 5'-phosphosulfate transporter), member B3
MQDYCLISILAMAGAYFTNWALNFLNYTTRIVFKSCRVIPVMAFRTLVVGQRYSPMQYGAGIVLVLGITLFTMGDADGMPNFHPAGVGLITIALVSASRALVIGSNIAAACRAYADVA